MAVVGVLAHVDAGKTTFSEQILYHAGVLRQPGRVDHQNTFLDTEVMEKERGITIFSGQAFFSLGHAVCCWLDTPGHVDFSEEMEHSLSVMDYAVLIVSCPDGIQSHTETLWSLLRHWKVPVILFLNKCDRDDGDPDRIIQDMKKQLSADVLDCRSLQAGCISSGCMEDLCALDEQLMNAYLEGNADEEMMWTTLADSLARREVFPVLAGSALTGDGIDSFLNCMKRLIREKPSDGARFMAQCYQVRHDNGQKICFIRILSGTLQVRDTVRIGESNVKIPEIRMYQGEKYSVVSSAGAGTLAALPIREMRIGDVIGQTDRPSYQVSPMMVSTVEYDQSRISPHLMMQALRVLEEENPSIQVENNEKGIHLHIMGPMQMDILRDQMLRRFGYSITFGPLRVLYHETIASPVVGIGHYEPLRHYAEVHLRLVPLPRGSGIRFRSWCSVDNLSLNWQRLIRTHVMEKSHRGVLTGSPLTDVSVELLCGKDHLKHTEGGDFRQATYRAIRNALMQADSVLLEPVCRFEIRVPSAMLGSVSAELMAMHAVLKAPEAGDRSSVIRGCAFYSLFAPWQARFMMMTHGKGSMVVSSDHEENCHNQKEIVEMMGYRPLSDPEDTPDSVFCRHGAGYNVPWEHVREHAHLETPEVLPDAAETKLD